MSAQQLRHLCQQQADAAGGGVDDDPVAFLDRIGVGREVVGGDPLEQDGGRNLGRDAIGDGDQPVAIGGHPLRVAL